MGCNQGTLQLGNGCVSPTVLTEIKKRTDQEKHISSLICNLKIASNHVEKKNDITFSNVFYLIQLFYYLIQALEYYFHMWLI